MYIQQKSKDYKVTLGHYLYLADKDIEAIEHWSKSGSAPNPEYWNAYLKVHDFPNNMYAYSMLGEFETLLYLWRENNAPISSLSDELLFKVISALKGNKAYEELLFVLGHILHSNKAINELSNIISEIVQETNPVENQDKFLSESSVQIVRSLIQQNKIADAISTAWKIEPVKHIAESVGKPESKSIIQGESSIVTVFEGQNSYVKGSYYDSKFPFKPIRDPYSERGMNNIVYSRISDALKSRKISIHTYVLNGIAREESMEKLREDFARNVIDYIYAICGHPGKWDNVIDKTIDAKTLGAAIERTNNLLKSIQYYEWWLKTLNYEKSYAATRCSKLLSRRLVTEKDDTRKEADIRRISSFKRQYNLPNVDEVPKYPELPRNFAPFTFKWEGTQEFEEKLSEESKGTLLQGRLMAELNTLHGFVKIWNVENESENCVVKISNNKPQINVTFVDSKPEVFKEGYWKWTVLPWNMTVECTRNENVISVKLRDPQRKALSFDIKSEE